MLWPSWLDQTPSPPLPEAISGLICYGLLLAFMIRPLHRSGTSLRTLFRRPAAPTATRWAITTGVAVMGISVASLYAVFLPLSYARPDFVQWWLIEDPVVLIWTHGDHYPIANLLNFLFLILIGPFIEELFFRGLLLASWASRWGPTRAVIFSSLLFAVLHLEILGSFIFGVVVSLTFLKTGSLWLPFIIHVTNNALVWILGAGDLLILGESTWTLADFQDSWWLGVTGLVAGLPLLRAVMSRVPRQSANSDTARQGCN